MLAVELAFGNILLLPRSAKAATGAFVLVINKMTRSSYAIGSVLKILSDVEQHV